MRIVIKVGSNVLTRQDGKPNVTNMSALVDQIAAIRSLGHEVVLVSSGAVACGRGAITPSRQLDSVAARQLYSSIGQIHLINLYNQLFAGYGLVIGQVLTQKENFGSRTSYLNQRACMLTMLDNGVVPIVNENDTASLTELMFTDNDELSGLIAAMMDAERLIILSNIDGMYTGDPADPASRLIGRIALDDDPTGFVAAGKSSHGRGGMASKCRIARLVAADGIEVVIANGKREGILTALCSGTEVPHTVFEPAPRPASSVKKWIAHSGSFAKGTLRINDGAAEALLRPRGGVSLLAVGVDAVEGDFDADDIVTIVTPGGDTIGWGRVSVDARTASGMLGKAGGRPLIHADYLYIS